MTNRRADLAALVAGSQRPDGSWESLSFDAETGSFARPKSYSTTFMTATIAGALAGVSDPTLGQVKQRAADFLVAQASEQWSYGYWARGSAQAIAQPYPDDWDDTACALAALMQLRPEVLSGAVVAQVVQQLTATETAEGGPYRTWIVGSDAEPMWQDVDLAVNSNIAYLLHLQGVVLPNLTALASRHIAQDKLTSPYYPSAFPIVYFLSRWYEGEEKRTLVEWVESQIADRAWGSPLEAALLLSAGCRLGVNPVRFAPAREYLKRAAMKAYAFCYDPAIDGRPQVAGAPALTAALTLEALSLYEHAREVADVPQTVDPTALRLHKRVVDRVRQRLEAVPASAAAAMPMLQTKILEHDPAKQITLLPYLFARALGPSGEIFTQSRLTELGAASLYGWVAYTIYDDFLDNEGRPVMLPLANLALRELVLILDREPDELKALAWSLLDRMEAANSWEVSHCRITRQSELLAVAVPDYGDLSRLADRSIGHAIGSLAMLMELGSTDSFAVRALEDFYRHLLIARQLSDEAHDWKPDLESGHINAVGAMLLAAVPRRGRRVAELYRFMEQEFWGPTLVTVCDLIDKQLAEARSALRQCKPIARPEVLEALLEPIAAASRRARTERTRTVDFLRAYGH